MSWSVSAHRPSTYHGVSTPSPVVPATLTSSQVPDGVTAFQDGITSVTANPGTTSGEVQVASS